MSRERLSSLRDLLYLEVPLSRHMGVVADEYDGSELTLAAELAPNINIHGTAFGGSLYALAALCGWSLLRLRLEDLSLRAEVVLGAARIDYSKPVRSRLMARACCDEDVFDAFAEQVRQGRRASIETRVTLGGVREQAWRDAAVFTGSFSVI